MEITNQTLLDANACKSSIVIFNQTFPNGIQIDDTVKSINIDLTDPSDYIHLHWIIQNLAFYNLCIYINDPINSSLRLWEFDHNGNETFYKCQNVGDDNSNDFWVKQTYNYCGDLIRKEDQSGLLETWQWEDKKLLNYTSSNGTIIDYIHKEGYLKVIENNGNWDETFYKENHWPIKTIDSTGKWYTFEYDDEGYIICEKGSNNFWRKAFYDERKNIIKEECSDGHWVIREFNERDQLLKETHEDGRWASHTYDDKGRETLYENHKGFHYKTFYNDINNIVINESSLGKLTYKKYEDDKLVAMAKGNKLNDKIELDHNFIALDEIEWGIKKYSFIMTFNK